MARSQEQRKLENLRNWVNKGGSQINKVDLKHFTETNRGVVATDDIQKDDLLMFIPVDLILTFEIASKNEIGYQMLRRDMWERFGEHYFFV